MQIDQPAAAALRFAKIVKSRPKDHAYDVVFLDDGSLGVGVQKLETNTSNNAGTSDVMTVDQSDDDPWSPELQSTKDQTKRDIIAVIAMVGVTPVIIGTLPPAISQLNFPDDRPNLHLERHPSDFVHTTEDNGDYCLMHPAGAYITISKDGGRPTLEKQDYDQKFEITRNKESYPELNLYTKSVGGDGSMSSALAKLKPTGVIDIAASEQINLSANKIYLN